MSKKPQGINIPWILIILSFVFGAWPLGVVLTLLRVLPLNSSSGRTSNSSSTQYTNEQIPRYQQPQENSAAARPAAQQNKNIYSAGRGADVRTAAPAAPAQKKKKKKSAARILRIAAVALLACGILSGLGTLTDIISGGLAYSALGDLFTSLYLLIGGGVSWAAADVLKRRERDAVRYAAMIGDRESYSLTKLSSATTYKIAKVRRDLQRMIDDGVFGDQAYIDMTNLCFMRTPDAQPDGVAQQYGDVYKRTMSSAGADIAGASAHEESAAPSAEAEEETTDMTDFDSILRKIRRLDDEIRDEPVSERIRKIEAITRNIFEYVKDKPEKMTQIRMFMNYYLPTTLKLLESYSRIERVGVAGQNMRDAKENIEKILDMLVVGFEQQFDQLFKAESLDISSDIEVLEQMMSKDGLTENTDFVIRENPASSFGEEEYTDDISEENGAAAVQQKPQS